jgi:hypothetical protein
MKVIPVAADETWRETNSITIGTTWQTIAGEATTTDADVSATTGAVTGAVNCA